MVHLETGSRTVLNLIQQANDSFHRHTQLVNAIYELLHRNWNVKLDHIYREANYIADCMENLAKSMNIGCHKFQTAPLETRHLLDYDKLGSGHRAINLPIYGKTFSKFSDYGIFEIIPFFTIFFEIYS